MLVQRNQIFQTKIISCNHSNAFSLFVNTQPAFVFHHLTDFCIIHDQFSAGTQSSQDVSLWTYFGHDVPNHNMSKIGHIKVLTYFGSAMSDINLASGNMENFPKTLFSG